MIVAKARSHTSRDLDLNFYPFASAGTFTLGVERLTPLKTYDIGGHSQVTADEKGKLTFDIRIAGRTKVQIVPIDH